MDRHQFKENEATHGSPPSGSVAMPPKLPYEFFVSLNGSASMDLFRTIPLYTTHTGTNNLAPNLSVSGLSVASTSAGASGQHIQNLSSSRSPPSTGHHAAGPHTLLVGPSYGTPRLVGEPSPLVDVQLPLPRTFMGPKDLTVFRLQKPYNPEMIYTFAKPTDAESRLIWVKTEDVPFPSQRTTLVGAYNYLPDWTFADSVGRKDLRAWLSPAAWEENGTKLTNVGLGEATYLVYPNITPPLLEKRHRSGDIVVPRGDPDRTGYKVKGCTICNKVDTTRSTCHVNTGAHREKLAKALNISVAALPWSHMFPCQFQFFGCNFATLAYEHLRKHEKDCEMRNEPRVPVVTFDWLDLKPEDPVFQEQFQAWCEGSASQAELKELLSILEYKEPEEHDLERAG